MGGVRRGRGGDVSGAGETGLLAWAALVFVWTVVNYLHRLDPVDAAGHRGVEGRALRRWRWGLGVRAVVGAGVAWWIVGGGTAAVWAAGVTLAGAVALPAVRAAWARSPVGGFPRDFRPEWELACNAAFLVAAWLIVDGAGAPAARLAEVPAGPARFAGFVLVALSAAIFLVRGGTHVVRGVLEKSDTLPEETGARETDVRHGVTIGNLERFLVLVLTALGEFGALGLVIAAKGLVRAVEWRDREMLEYFLVGTLASVSLALAVGLAVRWAATAWL